MVSKTGHQQAAGFGGFGNAHEAHEDITAGAVKRTIAEQLDVLMRQQGIDRSELARRLRTSRTELDRLLDPDSEAVTLGTLARAARTVGRELRVELV